MRGLWRQGMPSLTWFPLKSVCCLIVSAAAHQPCALDVCRDVLCFRSQTKPLTQVGMGWSRGKCLVCTLSGLGRLCCVCFIFLQAHLPSAGSVYFPPVLETLCLCPIFPAVNVHVFLSFYPVPAVDHEHYVEKKCLSWDIPHLESLGHLSHLLK